MDDHQIGAELISLCVVDTGCEVVEGEVLVVGAKCCPAVERGEECNGVPFHEPAHRVPTLLAYDGEDRLVLLPGKFVCQDDLEADFRGGHVERGHPDGLLLSHVNAIRKPGGGELSDLRNC